MACLTFLWVTVYKYDGMCWANSIANFQNKIIILFREKFQNICASKRKCNSSANIIINHIYSLLLRRLFLIITEKTKLNIYSRKREDAVNALSGSVLKGDDWHWQLENLWNGVGYDISIRKWVDESIRLRSACYYS